MFFYRLIDLSPLHHVASLSCEEGMQFVYKCTKKLNTFLLYSKGCL